MGSIARTSWEMTWAGALAGTVAGAAWRCARKSMGPPATTSGAQPSGAQPTMPVRAPTRHAAGSCRDRVTPRTFVRRGSANVEPSTGPARSVRRLLP
jgi:hypothetical protein